MNPFSAPGLQKKAQFPGHADQILRFFGDPEQNDAEKEGEEDDASKY